jgi:transcriptional regulator with XRE-family HTH domain
VPATERNYDRGSRRARSIAIELGNELRRARLEHGLSQDSVARVARTSRAQVSRIERSTVAELSILQASRLLAVVGLELGAHAYPAGQPIRDGAHLALIERLRRSVHPDVAWHFEVPIGLPGDQRAWDAVLSIGTARVAVEVETRLRDIQAVQRRISLKRRDDRDVSAVVLLLSNTRNNRNAVRAYGDSLKADFPVDARRMLGELAAGRHPGGSGVVLL